MVCNKVEANYAFLSSSQPFFFMKYDRGLYVIKNYGNKKANTRHSGDIRIPRGIKWDDDNNTVACATQVFNEYARSRIRPLSLGSMILSAFYRLNPRLISACKSLRRFYSLFLLPATKDPRVKKRGCTDDEVDGRRRRKSECREDELIVPL